MRASKGPRFARRTGRACWCCGEGVSSTMVSGRNSRGTHSRRDAHVQPAPQLTAMSLARSAPKMHDSAPSSCSATQGGITTSRVYVCQQPPSTRQTANPCPPYPAGRLRYRIQGPAQKQLDTVSTSTPKRNPYWSFHGFGSTRVFMLSPNVMRARDKNSRLVSDYSQIPGLSHGSAP